MNYLKFLSAFLMISVLASCASGVDEGSKVTPAPAANQVGATQPTQQQPASAQSGLNPAHGQPGHRCDIQVGAPLNSAPAQPTNTAPGVTVNPAAPTAPVSTGSQAGLNPAHGQPGHRCDIAVGAPLNSKPAQ